MFNVVFGMKFEKILQRLPERPELLRAKETKRRRPWYFRDVMCVAKLIEVFRMGTQVQYTVMRFTKFNFFQVSVRLHSGSS